MENDNEHEIDAQDETHDRRLADPGVENRDHHPVGTTTGTGAGAVAGAVVGTVLAGPVGTVVGGVVGGVMGGVAGHGVAAVVHPEGDQVDGDIIPDPGTTAHTDPAHREAL
jgi:phage tail tape-measure protein